MNDPNRLAKAGAHLRWFLESSGIDPEKVFVSIGLPTAHDLGVFQYAARKYADGKVVKIPVGGIDNIVDVHGVHIVGVVHQREKQS